MANANATALKLAHDIIEDFKGSQYYRVLGLLAELIGGSLRSPDRATEVAAAILQDWDGARYYGDEQLLAQYLEGQGVVAIA